MRRDAEIDCCDKRGLHRLEGISKIENSSFQLKFIFLNKCQRSIEEFLSSSIGLATITLETRTKVIWNDLVWVCFRYFWEYVPNVMALPTGSPTEHHQQTVCVIYCVPGFLEEISKFGLIVMNID